MTTATIAIWDQVKNSFIPTPQKFHYVFSMRELARIFQGMLQAKKEVINGALAVGTSVLKPQEFLIALWKHECERTFKDKMTELKDQDKFIGMINNTTQEYFEFEPQTKIPDMNI